MRIMSCYIEIGLCSRGMLLEGDIFVDVLPASCFKSHPLFLLFPNTRSIQQEVYLQLLLQKPVFFFHSCLDPRRWLFMINDQGHSFPPLGLMKENVSVSYNMEI
ncbi:hypothetical protein Ancab_039942 [Ancistrocladus abbreviatus]